MPHNQPRKIIKDGVIVEDTYTLIDNQEAFDALDANTDALLPLALFNDNHAAATARAGNTGVLIGAEDGIDSIIADLPSLALVALDFPKFMDGRAYSYARELRQRHAFDGDVRAVGDVLKDQLFYMKQVGFTSFATREDRDIEIALTALDDYAQTYLGDIFNHQPWFTRG